MAALIGASEMTEQVELRHLRRAAQTRMPGAHLGRAETQPMHAAVELQPDPQRLLQIGRQQGVGLLGSVHRHIQPQLRRLGIFSRLETAFQQQNARAGMQLTHHDRLLDTGHGKAVSQLQQGADHLTHTMAVGIRLDHGKGLATRRAALSQGVVMLNGGKIDGGKQRTHGHSPERKRAPILTAGRPFAASVVTRAASSSHTVSRRRTDSCPAPGFQNANTCPRRPGAKYR